MVIAAPITHDLILGKSWLFDHNKLLSCPQKLPEPVNPSSVTLSPGAQLDDEFTECAECVNVHILMSFSEVFPLAPTPS